MFHSLQCEVHGSDISVAVLAQARRRLADMDLPIPLKQVDFRQLPENYDREFDAVMCLFNSITHLLVEEETLQALRSMREVLRDGGILVMDQGTTDKSMRERPRFWVRENDRDRTTVFVTDYTDRQTDLHILEFTHTEQHSGFKVFDFRFLVLLQDDYARLLESAGFRSCTFYGGFDFSPYDKEQSDRLIVVTRK
jgi:ubiquinone/menaquinone biosynthesis C-methylase UbiE